jgi:hypothetical protein
MPAGRFGWLPFGRGGRLWSWQVRRWTRFGLIACKEREKDGLTASEESMKGKDAEEGKRTVEGVVGGLESHLDESIGREAVLGD